MIHQYFTHNFKLVSLAKAVLYYCLCSAKTEADSLDRLQSFLNDRDAVNIFFSNSISEQDSEPSEWIECFVSLLLSLDTKTPTFLTVLYSSLQSKSFAILSPTQLVLIHYILYIVDESPGRFPPRFSLRRLANQRKNLSGNDRLDPYHGSRFGHADGGERTLGV